MAETLEGKLIRVRFQEPERGFSVLMVEHDGQIGAWVGTAPTMREGAVLKATGEWETGKYGPQFKFTMLVPQLPANVDGILAYLAGGVLPGVGPIMAARIVKRFGEDTFAALADYNRLCQVEGIGPKTAANITEAWKEEAAMGEVMAALAAHGVSPVIAAKIVKRYKGRAIDIVTREPYRLAMEIDGVGFATADKIAASVGIAPTDPGRLAAGVLHALNQATLNGDCYVEDDALAEAGAQLLAQPPESLYGAVTALEVAHRVVVAEFTSHTRMRPVRVRAVFPAALHAAELAIATRLTALCAAGSDDPLPGAAEAIAAFEAEAGVTLDGVQRDAVELAARSKVMVVTGGPGTGKSLLTKAILAVFAKSGINVLLASPTGKAAKRLSEATGKHATTIHRMLGFDPQTRGFLHSARNPLRCSALVVDECSMMDCRLFASVLDAIPTGARLVLVGDVDQLPSVGPGAVLRDVIDSGVIPTARLTRIFRQGPGSTISRADACINAGRMPETDPWPTGEFFMVKETKGEEATATVVDLVSRELPQRFGYKPQDIQVIAPMRKGDAGVIRLNEELAAVLNPHGEQYPAGLVTFRVGDRVIQTKNDYQRDVFNGDQGVITRLDPDGKGMVVTIDGREVHYTRGEVGHLLPAYAITCHRMQGAEAPCIVVVMLREHYMLLSRNLLYTATTRGRKLVVLVADPSAVTTALSETRREVRRTRLAAHLRAGAAKPAGTAPAITASGKGPRT